MQSILQGKLILSGGRDKQTRMWKLLINYVYNKHNMIKDLDLHIPRQQRQVETRVNVSNNLNTLLYKHQQLKYMHQWFFSPSG